MSKGIFNVPYPQNEPVKSYAPGSPEKRELKAALAELKSGELDVPMFIGGQEIRTDNKAVINPPHEHKHVLGHYHVGDETHVHQAINAALDARKSWAALTWEHRASIFLKAADLLAGPFRARMNAATMLGQSKNVYQAEIDAACELIDFLKFNAYYMQEIYMEQPDSLPGMWNRTEYRGLEVS